MIYLVTFLVMLIVVTVMSIGVIMGRKPITGSCGGVGAALKDENYVCEYCGGDESKCETRQQQMGQSNLGYDASRK
ncbi:(Na+)-NQR maturation NqrM [Halioxenophilus sp. WMMB6]|uniref:(Na+)-NQR maturation NqrM n=1 Tax=Halioxenophilus sp. WMMB6 TaxID=3073815 RepID=UPI00295F2F62|nr:(Na+)-NQR maturation NqrM [Halioxenophilus sp. WMMB6]